MPNAIIAIRRYPTAIVLALALFLASLAIAAGSLGKTGGDGDDEGSGFGGTGRTGEFGGSGLGGTGMPSPLVINTQKPEDISDNRDTEVAVGPNKPQPRLSTEFDHTLPEIEQSASPIIAELNSTLEERSTQGIDQTKDTSNETALPTETVQPTEIAEAPSIQEMTVPPASKPITVEPPKRIAKSEENALDNERHDSTAAESNTAQIAEIQERAQQTEDNPIRIEMPDRIQRPELPPVQRVRPVERISIMPPRAQPMRI